MFSNYRDLPFVDEHSLVVDAPREQVWERLVSRAPSTGFRVTESLAPERHVLEGRHPFSRYALVFLLDAVESGGAGRAVECGSGGPRGESGGAGPAVESGGTCLRAQTW